ncbi:hypothetical protein [Streptomyces sp. H27-D2]|nr:hypothetical protein [Streptomyces sp. H27-D2]MEC4018185.1 hypothetical protein [Streptomyces sp. H27-D2]
MRTSREGNAKEQPARASAAELDELVTELKPITATLVAAGSQ